MFRHAHSVKGMASSMGFEGIASLAHRAEDLVDGIRSDPSLLSRETVDLLLAATDSMLEQVRAAGAGAPIPEPGAILTQLNTACAGSCEKAADLGSAIAAVQAALAAAPSARLETQPSLLFVSASAGDRSYLQAVGLINEGRYEDAIASLHSAQAAFGAHPDILTYLGFANRKLGRFETAETYYRHALAAAPNHKGATEYYGELMVERGDMAGAGAQLYNVPLVLDEISEAIEELPIERLVSQLTGDRVGIPPRDRVVRGPRVFLTEKRVSLRHRPVQSVVCSPPASSG
jgi:chemotaxis protein histidine kinase CheA